MIVAVGIDSVDIPRIAALWTEHGDRFLQRIYTAGERAYCQSLANPIPSLAARFAAKEAVMKCLGTGWAAGVGFQQIEVVRTGSGGVGIALHGAAAAVAQTRGIRRLHLSLTHTATMASAFAVAEG